MPDWSTLIGSNRTEEGGADLANSRGTAVVSSTVAANAKGNYVQMIAATAFDAAGILVAASSGGDNDFLMDIAVGAASSEQDIISNLLVSRGKQSHVITFVLPIHIAAGVRISARCQAGAANQTLHVNVMLLANPFLASAPLQRCETYGANTADSGGVSIDPGGTANTKGAYSQLAAATSARIRQLIIAIGTQNNATMTTANWLVDVAIGGAGSEHIVYANLQAGTNAGSDALVPAVIGPLPCLIPTGTRLAIRAQCSINDASDRLIDAVIYGVT